VAQLSFDQLGLNAFAQAFDPSNPNSVYTYAGYNPVSPAAQAQNVVNRPSTWEGFNASTPQGGHSEAQILAAAIAYGASRGLEPVYLKDNGQFKDGTYQIKFRDTKLGGVSTTEAVPMEGFGGNYTLSGGGGGGGGGGGAGGPVTTAIPGAAGYAQKALFAKTAYQNALARINHQRSGALRDWGYAGEFDEATGVTKNLRVDGANNYGFLQQANRSQAMRAEDAVGKSVERGLGRGGLAAQMQSDLRYDFGQEDSKLANALIERLLGLQDEQTQSKFEMDRALYEAELEAAREAMMQRLFNQANYSSGSVQQAQEGPNDLNAGERIWGANSLSSRAAEEGIRAAWEQQQQVPKTITQQTNLRHLFR
jgi:hypothetical protein